MGRWSRLVAREFLLWLELPVGLDWLDVGCGTGALAQVILERAAPKAVAGLDPSEEFVAFAREHVPAAKFITGDAQSLPFGDESFDVSVAGLVINFLPDPASGAREMARVVRPRGTVAGYVWDYAEGMQLMRVFWDAAVELNPKARELDEGNRFRIARPPALADLFERAGLAAVEVRPIDVPTVFRNFDDYWTPFLGGQAPAPAYAMALGEDDRAALRERIRERLPISGDGSISLTARAWAVRGSRPG